MSNQRNFSLGIQPDTSMSVEKCGSSKPTISQTATSAAPTRSENDDRSTKSQPLENRFWRVEDNISLATVKVLKVASKTHQLLALPANVANEIIKHEAAQKPGLTEIEKALSTVEACSSWTYEPTIDGSSQDRFLYFTSEISQMVIRNFERRKAIVASILGKPEFYTYNWDQLESKVERCGSEAMMQSFKTSFDQVKVVRKAFKDQMTQNMDRITQKLKEVGDLVHPCEVAGYSTYWLLCKDLEDTKLKLTPILDGGSVELEEPSSPQLQELKGQDTISQPDCVKGTVFEGVKTLTEFEKVLGRLVRGEVSVNGSTMGEQQGESTSVEAGLSTGILQFGDMPSLAVKKLGAGSIRREAV